MKHFDYGINKRQNRGRRRRLTARTVGNLQDSTDRLATELGVGSRQGLGIGEQEPSGNGDFDYSDILAVLGMFAVAGLVNVYW